jgi:uncharacterized phiE125 gp8 family phage protein
MLSRFDSDDLRGRFVLNQTEAPTAEPISLTEAKLHLRIDTTADDALVTALIMAARQIVEDWTGLALVKQSWAYSFQQWYKWEIELPRAAPLLTVDSIKYYDVNNTLQTVDPTIYQTSKAASVGRVRPYWNQVWPSVWWRMDAITIAHTSGYLLPASVDTTSNIVTCIGHPYANGDAVRIYNTDNAPPGGLSAETDYYVISAATDTFELSTTAGGSAIDITSTGTGNTFVYQGRFPDAIVTAIKLLIGHLYENRQEITIDTGRATMIQLPLGIAALLTPYRVNWF